MKRAGMPSLRRFPDPPGVGILRSRTGRGRNEPSLRAARRSSRNPGTPTASSTQSTVRPSTPGVFAPWLPATRPNATTSVAGSCSEVEQGIKPAAKISRRPAVKLGLHPRYPRPRPLRGRARSTAIQQHNLRHCSLLPFSRPLPPFPMRRALPGSEGYGGAAPSPARAPAGGSTPPPPPAPAPPRLGVLRRFRPVPGRSADGGLSPQPSHWQREATGRTRTVPAFTVIRSTKEEPSSTPAASPRLPRSTSPWPPGPASASLPGSSPHHHTGTGAHRARPVSTRFEPVAGAGQAVRFPSPLQVKSTADVVSLAGSFSVGLFPNRARKFPRTLLSSDHFG